MKSDFYDELYRVATFLGVKVTFKDLWCAGLKQKGVYLREKPDWLKTSVVYTKDLRRIVEKETDHALGLARQKYQDLNIWL